MKKKPQLKALVFGLMLGLAASQGAFAQSTSSAVNGRITDPEGRPIAGAVVEILHVPSNTRRSVVTDAQGRYTSSGLRVGGPYKVTVTKDGFSGEAADGVTLSLGETAQINMDLDPAMTTLEAVEVFADSGESVFSSNKQGAGTNLSRREIESLPSINGNIQDYMRLDPRVAYTDRSSGSITAGGMNPRFNKITIDGVSASDTFGLEGNNMPTQRQPVSIQAIEAIDISLSNYDVTIAGAAGANVNAVTKSGGNEFHGSIYGNYRDGDWFGEHPLTGADFTEFTKEETYGGTFSGPLIEDRLFFFANYEKYTRGKPSPDLTNTPLLRANGQFGPTQLAEVQRIAREVWGFEPGETTGNGDTELEERALKLDWNISENHRANLRYSRLDQTRVRPEGSNANAIALSSNWYDHEKDVESIVGQVFSDWSSSFSTEFKVSYRDYSANRVNPTTAPTIQVFFDDGVANNNPSAGQFIRLGTERSSMGNSLSTKTWDYFGSALWTLEDHDLKFGFQYSDNDIYNYFLQDSWGNYSFFGIDNFRNGIYFDYDLQYQTAPGSVPAIYTSENVGLFLQDTWYVSSNLTMTYGLRADRPDTSPSPTFNSDFAAPQTINSAGRWTGGFGYDNSETYSGSFILQPRFGFNYTFDTERPTQLRGGLGLFQGDAPQVWTGNAYNSTGLNYIAYSNYRHCNYTGPTEGGRNATCLNTLFNPDGLNPTVPPSASANRNVNVIAPNFELPSVWKANLAIEHELPWWGMVASAEVLLSDVENGLFYKTLNVGPGFIGPDGRVLYWNPSNRGPFGTAATPRFNNNSAFGDVFLIENTNKGKSQQLTLSLTKPFTSESDWSWMVGYTYTDAEEVGALTSSTAGSGYGNQYGFNVNDPTSSTARYEIKDRFTGTLNWKHSFFGDYETQIGLVYEGRSGRPFSYIFSGDANGDNRTFNDLFYVPNGDVLFGSLSSSGVFTANPAMAAAFQSFLDSHPDLARYAGQHAPENAFNAGWVHTFDVRLTQQLPGFYEGHKSELWIDIQNIGNLLNDDWGHILDYGFNGNEAVATLVGIYQGQYVYGYRTGTQFGQPAALGVPTDADAQTNGISQWSVQVGFKYSF